MKAFQWIAAIGHDTARTTVNDRPSSMSGTFVIIALTDEASPIAVICEGSGQLEEVAERWRERRGVQSARRGVRPEDQSLPDI